MGANRREFIRSAAAAGAAVFAGGSAGAEPTGSGSSGGAGSDSGPWMTELFLDNHLLEATPGVSRRLHQPRKHLLNPVVRSSRWCDGNYIQPYTTMYDEEDKLFKMWARTGSDWKSDFLDGNAAYMLYFTSQDGVNWDKPDPGVMEIGKRRDHNIIFTSDLVLQSPTRLSYGPDTFVVPTTPMVPQGKKAFFWGVNKHPHPRDASEKFVALAIVQDHRRGAHIVTSPDGIHWSCASSPFWQTPHDVSSKGDDCLMHLIYDQRKQKWVIYRRIVPEFSERMIADARDLERPGVDRYNRSYAYAESEDLKEWKHHQFILAMDADDPADTELYQFGCHKIGEIYVGYMSVYYLRRPQPINIHLATSRDGIHFSRVCRGEAFIRHGDLGYYDYMAMACSQPEPIVVNDTVYFYYASLNSPHDVDTSGTSGAWSGGASLATMKRDRFASLETGIADAAPCRVLTKPFVVRHPRLSLNAATWSQGSIQVEVLSREWEPVSGFTLEESRAIQGDALGHPVRWKNENDLGKLLGKEIRLKFYMTRARIHAMTLSNEERPISPVESEYRYDPAGDSAPKLN